MIKKRPKRGLPPMHPGELLRDEILPALDRSKTDTAKLLGVSHQTRYDILDEKQPVPPVVALRRGKLCGNRPDLWLNLQKRYDLQRAEQEFGEKIEASDTGSGMRVGARGRGVDLPLSHCRLKGRPTLLDRRYALGEGPSRRPRCGNSYREFLDALYQHLTLPSVFERKINFIALLGPQDRLSKRRAD